MLLVQKISPSSIRNVIIRMKHAIVSSISFYTFVTKMIRGVVIMQQPSKELSDYELNRTGQRLTLLQFYDNHFAFQEYFFLHFASRV